MNFLSNQEISTICGGSVICICRRGVIGKGYPGVGVTQCRPTCCNGMADPDIGGLAEAYAVIVQETGDVLDIGKCNSVIMNLNLKKYDPSKGISVKL